MGILWGSRAYELQLLWEGNDERWAWYLVAALWRNEAGSRSWWYGEDFTKSARVC